VLSVGGIKSYEMRLQLVESANSLIQMKGDCSAELSWCQWGCHLSLPQAYCQPAMHLKPTEQLGLILYSRLDRNDIRSELMEVWAVYAYWRPSNQPSFTYICIFHQLGCFNT
jgi:hypothetical protein